MVLRMLIPRAIVPPRLRFPYVPLDYGLTFPGLFPSSQVYYWTAFFVSSCCRFGSSIYHCPILLFSSHCDITRLLWFPTHATSALYLWWYVAFHIAEHCFPTLSHLPFSTCHPQTHTCILLYCMAYHPPFQLCDIA